MNIVIITPYNFDSTIRGSTNRVLMLAKALARNASVTILHHGPTMCLKNLKLIHYNPFLHFSGSSPLTLQATNVLAASFALSLRKILNTIISQESIDVIQIETPYLFPLTYVICKHLKPLGIQLVLDTHNMDFLTTATKITSGQLFPSISSTLLIPYVFCFERFAIAKSDIVLCVSKQDSINFQRYYRIKKETVVIPNGVDITKFDQAQKKPKVVSKRKNVFFHGTYSWFPNLEAANIIVDSIASDIPESTFLLCGSNAPTSLLKKIRQTNNVKYLGYVDDLPRYIINADVCIAPIYSGGGTKLKLLEYAAAGKPIVATYKAVEGLPFEDNVNARIFNNVSEGFQEAIVQLLNDRALSAELGSEAYKLAKQFDWRKIGDRLFAEYSKISR